MLKTLHGYIAKDLIKIFSIVFTILTMLFTIIIVIEPLRKQGLAGSEVLFLFSLTIPIMATAMLPFAALFAATFVYGRFSQDNELLASKASGIGTITLLRPAMALGIVVMVLTMILNNFISPRLSMVAKRHVEANIRGIFIHQIKTKGYFKNSSVIIQADPATITASGDSDGNQYIKLTSVILVEAKDIHNIQVHSAQKAVAQIKMDTDRNECAVTIYFDGGCRFVTGRKGNLVDKDFTLRYPVSGTGGGEFQLIGKGFPFPLPAMPLKSAEKPSFFDWPLLMKTLRSPENHPEIRRELVKIEKELTNFENLKYLAHKIGSDNDNGLVLHRPKTASADETFTLRNARVDLVKDDTILISGTGDSERVELVFSDGTKTRIYHADKGQLWSAESDIQNKTFITIELMGNVMVDSENPPIEPKTKIWGDIALPTQQAGASIDLNKLYHHPDQHTANAKILRAIKNIKEHRVVKLERKILAEVHGRPAFGFSCLLMVTLGAALGVLFKGGEFVSAIALSAIPSLLTFLGISVLGMHLISNDGVELWRGVSAVWGSVTLLALANVAVIWRLSRR